MSFDLRLAGRRALVTGGTRGVGAAVVEVLHEAGARIAAAARSLPAQQVEGVLGVAARAGHGRFPLPALEVAADLVQQ